MEAQTVKRYIDKKCSKIYGRVQDIEGSLLIMNPTLYSLYLRDFEFIKKELNHLMHEEWECEI